MFEKGEFVVNGNNGVCQVNDITVLHMNGADRNRKYYVLKPVYSQSSTVYSPIDAIQSSMRRIVTKQEANELIDDVSDILDICIKEERAAENLYRESIMKNDCREWIRLWKTIYNRSRIRTENGQKVTAIDSKYFKMAEENLYGELAIALGVNRTDVEKLIITQMSDIK